MRFRKAVMVLAVEACLSACAGSGAEVQRPGIVSRGEAARILSNLTPEDRQKKIDEGRMAAEKRLGGFLTAPAKGRLVRVVNRQKTLPAEDVAKIANDVCGVFGFVSDVCSADPDDGKTGAKVELVEEDGLPTLLVAPEDCWSRINVRRLSADSPDTKLLRRRVLKEFWRAFAMALGAANSNYQPCVMRHVASLSDLDGIEVLVPCPEPYDKIQRTGALIGLAHSRRVSYRKACEEGWAPAPTNDVQKAIWERVKADKERGPANPITIPPPGRK